jgi:hypothetical protein
MRSYTLTHVSDEALLADLAALIARDRQTTAALLAHIGEVEARELFLPAACSTMHVYCVRVLHLAEEVAYKRIRAARAARRFPQLFGAIADGRLHVTGLVMLAPHLTDQNVDEVIAAATHRSKADIDVLVARLAPQPDLPAAVTPVESAPSPAQTNALRLYPYPIAAPPEQPVTRVRPLAPERFALQVTISQETRDKLARAQALLRHRHPSGDLADVLDRALDALLARLENEKLGATSRPRTRRARTDASDPRYVPPAVRRAVHARDGEQCTFTSETGERCTERGFLEFDHVTPVALGGTPTVDQTRVLCAAHNQYEAERILGADVVRARRAAGIAARTAGAATALPLLSVAIAVIDATPAAAGAVQVIDQLPLASTALPIEASLTNTWTLLIAPSTSDAVPLIVVAVVGAMNAFGVGVRMLMVGGTPVAPVTVTARTLDMPVRPAVSTTRASSR